MVLTLVAFTISPKHTQSMPSPVVWGTLPKAQDNPQTIEEAIASAISAHEADPEAHMGSGESIDVHRTNDTLDHPAGSVVNDKLTKRELRYITSFDSLDAWFTHGSVGPSDLFGVELSTEYGATDLSYLMRGPVSPPPWMTTGIDYLFATTLYVDAGTNHYTLSFGLGYHRSGATLRSDDGMGFKIVNGDLKATYSVLNTNHVTDIDDVDMSKPHNFSVQYFAEANEMTWFVDQVAVLTLSPDLSDWDNDAYVSVDLEATGAGSVVTDVYDMLVSRSL
jgi:hypothetical protein